MQTPQKIALVTGGSRGIGLAAVRQLAEAGVHVYLGARDERRGSDAARKIADEGLTVEFIRLDMEDPVTLSAVVEVLKTRHGVVDILINNAGVQIEADTTVTWDANTAPTIPPEILRRTFEVNLFGLIDLTNQLIPLIRKSPAGRVINLTSILGSIAWHADPTSGIYDTKVFAYSASKAALNLYTIHLAHYFRKSKVKVLSVHPGWVKTEMGGKGAHMTTEKGAKFLVDAALDRVSFKSGAFLEKGEELPW